MTRILSISSLALITMTSLLAFGESAPEHNRQEFAQSTTWLNPMYYVRHGKTYESLVVNSDYFFSREAGRKDPLLELSAALDIFRQVLPAGEGHPQCRFPYRYKVLKRHFALAESVHCPAFETWQQSYAPSGLSLVYASQFISNPSSVFGHSFLLVASPKQAEGLWLTYNYAASIPEQAGPVGYVWGGLNGWFTGDFSIQSFYQRLFHYGNVENRDLWIYPILLNQDEFDSTLRHLWEVVHHAKFKYYFLNENCAGALLRAFAAILPELKGYNHMPIYVHPIEIIKVLDRFGRLGPPRLVPSQLSVLRSRVSNLSGAETERFKYAIHHLDEEVVIEDAKVADALIEYTASLARQHDGETPTEYKKLERSAYVQRSKLKATPVEAVSSDLLDRAPHLAHDSMAAEVGSSVVNDHLVADLSYRVSLHGQLDPDPGFLDFSAFEFMKITASATDHALWLKELTVLNVESMQPFWSLAPQPSWRVKIRFKENLLTPNLTDQYFETLLSLGTGISVGPHLLYAMLVSSTNLGLELPQGHYELGPEFGFLARWSKIKSYAYIGLGENLFENTGNSFVKAGTGLSWLVHRNLSVIQENEWSYLTTKSLKGYRLSLGLRWNF